MLRKLLTLLAICAGLAAVGEPARAAALAVEGVHIVQRSGETCTARSTALATAPVSLVQRLDDKGKPCPRPTIVLVVPTVMLQVDRARE